MTVIKKILVAVDVSDYSLPALKYAYQLARTVQAKLTVVTVVDQRETYAIKEALQAYDEGLCEQILADKISDRREWLSCLIKRAGIRGILLKAVVREGIPYHEILKTIESAQPDLLVMGTKGRSGLADALVGSCAQKLFHRCPIPLLSFREPTPENAFNNGVTANA